ncbi:thymidine phosphorylase [Aliiroseovarius sp. KMU-50]|uniref:Thymidine phosphorylase n=1 Tax=Aliiroseovarius salicola TaxID=3009082 RepID=A0ABT4VWT8_9RHOB|nr:thymidine phosphorylase [Aliiroseovarius sp. KMU-50]MDA5092731.1 thymidine phosphorylase [Aliiroseovarius sp. KMU-50]
MLIAEIIRKKRDGATLSTEEISAMVNGIQDGSASEGQVAAFAMAVFFQGMQPKEAAQLTLSMRDSGDVFKWQDLPGPVVDKHSTGGVGDNVSLMLAPIVAACGGYVPMISGRGLGHTGGTLDKMEAVPGYSVTPDNEKFAKVVKEVGCAVIGQTANLAPADKRFYGIRDVTATVESIPLITASILSKKLSAGLESLVMDVKFGNGAFMGSYEEAENLALSITRVARSADLPCHALLTDMNQPLASAAGNAIEVVNAIEFLTGAHRDPRLEDVTLALCAEMLLTSGLQSDRSAAMSAVTKALTNGKAAEVFSKMVHALGGPSDIVENYETHLPKPKMVIPVPAPAAGAISVINTREVGLAVVELGGGRRVASDLVNPAVGLTGLLDLGVSVEKGDPIALVHADDAASAEAAKQQILSAYEIGDVPKSTPVLRNIIEG